MLVVRREGYQVVRRDRPVSKPEGEDKHTDTQTCMWHDDDDATVSTVINFLFGRRGTCCLFVPPES